MNLKCVKNNFIDLVMSLKLEKDVDFLKETGFYGAITASLDARLSTLMTPQPLTKNKQGNDLNLHRNFGV